MHKVQLIDTHTAGEPTRLVIAGSPELGTGRVADRLVVLRGFNWIVSPFEGGGHTIAVEIQAGAAAAGPFEVDQAVLDQMITRVVAEERVAPPSTQSVH